MMAAAPGRVVAVHTEFVVVEASGRRQSLPNRSTHELRPGDWVLIDAGAVVRRAAAPDAALDRAFEADLVDERRHYPTEDPETAPPVLHHPPAARALA